MDIVITISMYIVNEYKHCKFVDLGFLVSLKYIGDNSKTVNYTSAIAN